MNVSEKAIVLYPFKVPLPPPSRRIPGIPASKIGLLSEDTENERGVGKAAEADLAASGDKDRTAMLLDHMVSLIYRKQLRRLNNSWKLEAQSSK